MKAGVVSASAHPSYAAFRAVPGPKQDSKENKPILNGYLIERLLVSYVILKRAWSDIT